MTRYGVFWSTIKSSGIYGAFLRAIIAHLVQPPMAVTPPPPPPPPDGLQTCKLHRSMQNYETNKYFTCNHFRLHVIPAPARGATCEFLD